MMADEFLRRAAGEPRLVRARQQGATVLVVCCGGMRAQKAAELLAANGYKVAFLSDGLASGALPDQVLARVRK
jgi:rhodanese-related sulfurtransferase